MTESNLPMEISCHETHALLTGGQNDIFLLDCREQDEFDHCRIDGAVLIPMSELQERVSELEPRQNERIVVHCHHGGRSLRVAAWLRNQGYEKAQSMAGGIDEWSQTIDSSVPRY